MYFGQISRYGFIIKGEEMKKVILAIVLITSFATAMTCITTCDADGRNCLTTCF